MCTLLVYDFRRIAKWDQDLQDPYRHLEGMRKERARAQQNTNICTCSGIMIP